jgi:hypothetical protein
MSQSYKSTSAEARGALMNVEQAWGVPKPLALYELRGRALGGTASLVLNL